MHRLTAYDPRPTRLPLALRTRRPTEFPSLQIVHEIRHPRRPTAEMVHTHRMRPGTHNGQSARFCLNFCGGGIILLFLDAEIVLVPPQSAEGMGELVQLLGANKLESA